MIWVNENIKSGYSVLRCQEISVFLFLIVVYKTAQIPFCLWCTAGLSHKKLTKYYKWSSQLVSFCSPLCFYLILYQVA